MVTKVRADDDLRRKGDAGGDPISMSTIGLAFRILNEQTPVAVIALCAVGFLAYLYVTSLTTIARELHDHTRETGWYQRQMCISLAQLAGTPEGLCDRNDDRR